MIITYSGRSRPSAQKIAEQDSDISLVRGSRGDINWGRNRADTLLNPDISNATNKRVMRELFASHDVPMPRLLTRGNSILNFNERGHTWNYPIIGRPDRHTQGRGFWKCNSAADVDRALRGIKYRNGKRKAAATHFMEYVSSDREYRVHIFKGKSIRISEKNFGDDGYTTAKPRHNVSNVREAAKKAVAAIGLDFGAVDVLARGDDNEEVFVLEVNAAPGLGGSMPSLYADKFKEFMEEQDGRN